MSSVRLNAGIALSVKVHQVSLVRISLRGARNMSQLSQSVHAATALSSQNSSLAGNGPLLSNVPQLTILILLHQCKLIAPSEVTQKFWTWPLLTTRHV